MKRTIARILSVCLLIGALTISVAATSNREDDVEFILEMVSREPGSEYAWDTDGGRQTTLDEYNRTFERVWGWSTCFDKYGEKAYHYTHSRYETLIGEAPDMWSSGRVWGTGKVWAYSPYVIREGADDLRARVYYGL
mgnify:FL=1